MSLGLVSYGSSDEYSSDEGEDNVQASVAVIVPKAELPKQPETSSKTLNLPPPKSTNDKDTEHINLQLPAPKTIVSASVVEEADDEFLKKKAVPTVKPPKAPVRIVLPNLSEFKDDDDDRSEVKKPLVFDAQPKKSSLFSMLPKPKSEMSFVPKMAAESSKSVPTKNSNLVPHSVRNRPKEAPKKSPVKPAAKSLVQKYSDSESDDDESADFFSLHSKPSLPEVSANEIQLMVAQKAAKLSAASAKFDEMTAPPAEPIDYYPAAETSTASNNLELDAMAMESLVGASKAKRQKLLETNIIDISMSEIVQSKEEFLRQQIQQETSFTPTGRLVGNDADENSKKKHHITYLAHKAKANEAELQAMWSANRYSRQQTQNKYGF